MNSGDAIARWAANLNTLTQQTKARRRPAQRPRANAAPTADAVTAVFSDVREARCRRRWRNLEIVLDMLKRYNKGVEAVPGDAAAGASIARRCPPAQEPGRAGLRPDDQPAATLPPASCRPANVGPGRAPVSAGARRQYRKIPRTPCHVVRGARNLPCADFLNKRARHRPNAAATSPHPARQQPVVR